MNFRRIVWPLLLLCGANVALANDAYYDRQEQIRRDAQRLDEFERRQEEAARQRYDDAHSAHAIASTPQDDQELVIAFSIIGGGAVIACLWRIIYVALQEGKAEAAIARNRQYLQQVAAAAKEEERRKSEETGQKLVEIVNETAERTELSPSAIATLIQTKAYVAFKVEDGKLEATEAQLHQIEARIAFIRHYCKNLR